jgi:hypothetical protein
MMKGMAGRVVEFSILCKPIPLLLKTVVARQESISFEELFGPTGKGTVTDSKEIRKWFGEK